VAWRWERRAGRWTKPPCQPDGTAASTTDSTTWHPFGAVLAAYEARRVAGIGYVFSPDDPYCGIDQDHVRDPETRTVQPDAWAHVRAFASYTEVSPSGTGLHTIVDARLTSGGRRHGPVEIYDRGRFFTMTGNHLAGTPGTIAPAQAAIDAILVSFPAPAPKTGTLSEMWDPPSRTQTQVPRVDPAWVLSRARAARNGGKLERLWAGDDAGHPTPSEADLALVSILVWWTDDPATLDALFRQSGRMRAKWDEPRGASTYGDLTIARALARRTGASA
jgi:primase-polymerase (primpol)-like protein